MGFPADSIQSLGFEHPENNNKKQTNSKPIFFIYKNYNRIPIRNSNASAKKPWVFTDAPIKTESLI